MNATIKFFTLIAIILFGVKSPIQAQQFSGGSVLSDANLSGREWHITSKTAGFPLVSLWTNNSVVSLVNLPINSNSTFIVEDGTDDGDGWTPDVRWFHIRNRFNHLYLTVEGTTAGSAMGWESYQSSQGTGMWQQQFRLIPTGDLGWYKLRSRLSQNGPDLVLSVGSDGNLTVEAPELVGQALQQSFAFNLATPLDQSTNYLLLGLNNNDFISDQGISSEGAEAVHVAGMDYSCYWNFIHTGNGYYFIRNAFTGNYLSNNGSSGAGDQLYMNHNGSDNAKWKFVRNESTWSLRNKQSGYLISTRGEAGNRKPLYQSNDQGIGIKWAVLPITAEEPIYATAGYDHILDNAPPMNDCMNFGAQFQLAICERVGLPAENQYFSIVLDALNAHYNGNLLLARRALQNFDLNNFGHRVELTFAFRNYLLGALAHKAPQQLTPLENEVLTIFSSKVYSLRIHYVLELIDAAEEFEASINQGSGLFSELLDNLEASDFTWPGEYDSNSDQVSLMDEYAIAAKSLGLTNSDRMELGLNIFTSIEPVAIAGVATALTLGFQTGSILSAQPLTAALAQTIPELAALQAAQADIITAATAAGNAGFGLTIALVAAQIIAQEAMEQLELSRLGKSIIEKIQWGQKPVNFHDIMTGFNELDKLKLLRDLDYLNGAPETGFNLNTNDNYIVPAFNIYCNSNATVDLGSNGLATIAPLTILNSFPQAICGGGIQFDLSTTQFDCSDLGDHQVTLTAHNSSLSQSCTATITVQDQTAPTVNCKNATVFLGAGGTAAAGYPDVYQGGSDNCGTVNPQYISQTVFGCSHLGANVVTVTANDSHGNTATCNAVVTVVDNLAPTVNCKNATVYLSAGGTAAAGYPDVYQGGSDNCGTVNPEYISQTVFGCSHLGTNTITVTANDSHGNTGTCNAVVTVVDNLAPTVVCKNKTISLNAGGTVNILTSDVFQSGSDNCGFVNQVSVLPNVFDCNNLGVNPVTLTVNDGHGNNATCTATITVEDLLAPVMLCKAVTLPLNAAGQAILTPAQVNNGSYDNCAISVLSINRSVFTCTDLGLNTVSLEGVDQGGNKSLCYASVTIVDQIVPTAKCKNLTINLGSNGAVNVTPAQVNNGSSDNCSFSMTVTPANFSCANIGTNTVVFRATDYSGNSATCNALLTIKDASAPTALCKNATVFLNSNGQGTLAMNQVDNGSSDNCGVATKTLNLTQFSCAELSGSWTVTMTVKDNANNVSTCNSTVTVKDVIAPTPVCENTSVHLGSNGTVIVYPANLAGDSYDNCSVWSYSPSAKVYNTSNLGNNNLTITVKDFSNNAATCVSVVTVLPYNGSNNLQEAEETTGSVAAEAFAMRLFPNPSSGETNVAFDLPAEQVFVVRVFDMAGRLVYHREGNGLEGENTQLLKLGGIAAGMYTVDIQAEGLKAQKRLVIQQD